MDDVMNVLDNMKNNGELSDVSHGVLRKLAKKRKKERFWHLFRTITVILLSLCYLILLFSLDPYLKHQSAYSGFVAWFIIAWHSTLLFLIIMLHVILKVVVDRFKEVDGKYDRLRKEIIDREEEIWNRAVIDRLSRPKVLALFDEKDVNLYHK
ncbi:MAG TPA: DUF2663 family protein [Candidatus Angelobacter sp.]|nr:DUF2663 family protein [Candidatus Angelobacter sp.]